MKTRMNILTLSLALAALLGLANLASAQGPMMGGPGMMGGYGYGMGMISGLTPEKQAAVQKLYTDYSLATEPVRQQLFAKQSELNTLYYSGTTDTAKVQALAREIGDLNTKLYSAQANLRKQLAAEGVPASGMGMGGMGMGMGGMAMGYNGWNCW